MLLAPFSERSEIKITGPNEGRINVAPGFGNHGERVRRVLGANGRPERLHLAGTTLVPEAAMVREIEAR